ncbi:hypothetical protein PIB30_098281 [Stylosanthes scabra]|uniref:Uncharacterized protein n=1 Tax=Stylosanthes scabra TaxID=79078 RepID=A0ABU6TYL2_9FABA|nr:hypothetical protein [Stylosanthes scabra]
MVGERRGRRRRRDGGSIMTMADTKTNTFAKDLARNGPNRKITKMPLMSEGHKKGPKSIFPFNLLLPIEEGRKKKRDECWCVHGVGGGVTIHPPLPAAIIFTSELRLTHRLQLRETLPSSTILYHLVDSRDGLSLKSFSKFLESIQGDPESIHKWAEMNLPLLRNHQLATTSSSKPPPPETTLSLSHRKPPPTKIRYHHRLPTDPHHQQPPHFHSFSSSLSLQPPQPSAVSFQHQLVAAPWSSLSLSHPVAVAVVATL